MVVAWTMLCLLTGAEPANSAQESKSLEARAVVWRKVTTSYGGHWPAQLLVMNTGSKSVLVPRWPVAYNVQTPEESGGMHLDCGTASYPDGFEKLLPGEVQVFHIDIPKHKEYAQGALVISASFDIYIDGKKELCSVECTVSEEPQKGRTVFCPPSTD